MRLFKRLAMAFAVIGAVLTAHVPAQHAFTMNGPAIADHHTTAAKKAARKAARRAARKAARKKKRQARKDFSAQRKAADAQLSKSLVEIRRKAKASSETGVTWDASAENKVFEDYGRQTHNINQAEQARMDEIDNDLQAELDNINKTTSS